MRTKRIYKVLAGLLFLGLLGFSSCEKQELVRVIGFVQGHVFDGNTNEKLDGVSISWEVAGVADSTTATAADGYSINNLYSGNYYITCSKADYTTVTYYLSIPMDDFTSTVKGGANKEYIRTENPNLYPLNASMSGRIYAQENGFDVPAEGVTVQVDYNGESKNDEESYRFSPNHYQTTTDANGYYSFTNIPATRAAMRILDFTDANSILYRGTTATTIYLQPGETKLRSNYTMLQITDGIKLINSNLLVAANVPTSVFGISDNITLEFNKDVSEAITLANGFVTFSGGPTTVTYSGNTITIDPTADMTAGTPYTVSWNAYGTVPYDNTTGSIVFSTAP